MRRQREFPTRVAALSCIAEQQTRPTRRKSWMRLSHTGPIRPITRPLLVQPRSTWARRKSWPRGQSEDAARFTNARDSCDQPARGGRAWTSTILGRSLPRPRGADRRHGRPRPGTTPRATKATEIRVPNRPARIARIQGPRRRTDRTSDAAPTLPAELSIRSRTGTDWGHLPLDPRSRGRQRAPVTNMWPSILRQDHSGRKTPDSGGGSRW